MSQSVSDPRFSVDFPSKPTSKNSGSSGSGDNQFTNPSMLCWSESRGVLVVLDYWNHRVLVYH